MKTWEKYIDYLLKGEWHIHTNFTDGKNTVTEYCKKAIEADIPLLAFTEHVRTNLNYDFNIFLNDIDKARENFDLIILSGCEAKVLPNGEIDVENNVLREVDYPVFAFHSFPEDFDTYIKCLRCVLRNKYVNTWAHPERFLRKHFLEISESDLVEIFNLMRQQNILFEINKKHDVPSIKWINLAKKHNVEIVRGSDIHCIEDIRSKG